MRFARTILLLLPLLLVSGCGHRYYLSRKAAVEVSPWPFYRGDLAATGSLADGAFGGKLDVLWEYKSNDKPAGPMTIANGNLVYPGTKGKIKFIDLQSGSFRGYIKAKGEPQTGVVVKDNLAFFGVGPRRNVVYCYNLFTAEPIWSRPVKDAVPGSIIVNDRLIVGSGSGTLFALNIGTGGVEWTHEAASRFTAPPVYGDGRVYQVADDGTLYALASESGSELYRVKVGGPMVNAAAVSNRIYCAAVDGSVYAAKPEDGAVVWKATLDGPVWTAPAVSGDQVFVGNSAGTLVALEAASGGVRWAFHAAEVIKASAVAVGGCVVFGTMTGKVYSLSAADGTVLDQRDLKAAVATAPVTDGQRVYVATQSGRIYCFGERDGQLREENK